MITVTKCRDGVSSNTCEYVGRFTWSAALCSLVVTAGMPWTPVISNFHPRVQCPYKAVSMSRGDRVPVSHGVP